MNADHAAIIVCKHVSQLGLERASRLPSIAAELGKDCLTAIAVASD